MLFKIIIRHYEFYLRYDKELFLTVHFYVPSSQKSAEILKDFLSNLKENAWLFCNIDEGCRKKISSREKNRELLKEKFEKKMVC